MAFAGARDLAVVVTVLAQREVGFRSLALPSLHTPARSASLSFTCSLPLQRTSVPGWPERTKAGLAAAKARGRLRGGPRTMTEGKPETARQLRGEGHTLKWTAQRLVTDQGTESKRRPASQVCALLAASLLLGAEDLHEFCRSKAPAFMVPTYIEFVLALPKTPTQKIEKLRLRQDGITASTWDRVNSRLMA